MESISSDKKTGWFFGCLVINIVLIAGLMMMSNACMEEKRPHYASHVFDEY